MHGSYAPRWYCALRATLRALATVSIWLLSQPNEASAAEQELSTHELLTLTDIAAMTLSPSGRQLAFVTRRAVLERNSYDCELFVIETRRNDVPRRLGRVSPAVSVANGFVGRRLNWTGDEQAITYVADLDGSDQVWAWNVTGGAPRRLSNAAGGVVTHEMLADGKQVFFSTLALGGTAEQRKAAEESAHREGMLYSPVVLWGDYLGDRGVQRYVGSRLGAQFEHWIHDLGSGEVRAARPEEVQAHPRGFPGAHELDWYRISELGARINLPVARDSALSPDGRRQAVYTKRHEGQQESILSVIEGQKAAPIEWYRALEAHFVTLRWSPDSAYLYFGEHAHREGHGSRYSIRRIGQGQQQPDELYSTSAQIEQLQFDGRMQTAAWIESSANRPGRIVLLDLRSGAKRELYDPNTWLKDRRLPEPELLLWKNRYGVNAFGYLVKPVGASAGRQYPLVVVSYRASGFLRGGVGDEYPVYPLAAAGFAVLVLDAGEAYFGIREGDDFAYYSRYWSALATMEEALRKIRSIDWIDYDRKALTGLSYGADTAWYILTHADWFEAAALSDCCTDPFPFYMWGLRTPHKPSGWSALPMPIIDGGQLARWQEIGVSLNASALRAPVLLNEADSEFATGLGAVTTFTGLGKPFELVVYPNAGHNINQPAQRYSIYNRNIDWLRFWLMGEEDPAAAKAEQYKRWRLLKRQHEWNEQLWSRGQDPATEFARQRRASPDAIGTEMRAPLLNP